MDSKRGERHLPYSSRMIFSTRRTMLPTVVSDGWAAVILWPSVRIRSMSSPESGRALVTAAQREPPQASPSYPPPSSAGPGAVAPVAQHW